MPNVHLCGLKGGHGGKRLFAGGGVSTRTVVDQLPGFIDDNAGPMGCPSLEQIRERCAAVREGWDEARWDRESKRRHVEAGEHRSIVRHEQRDSTLMRNLLWRERFIR